MGFRFRKSIKLLPGLKLNLSKSGASLTVGKPGACINFGKNGTRYTVGLPGTGISYSSFFGKSSKKKSVPEETYQQTQEKDEYSTYIQQTMNRTLSGTQPAQNNNSWIIAGLLIVFAIIGMIYLFKS